MKIVNAIFIVLCAVFFIAVGGILIAVSLNLFTLSDIAALLTQVVINLNARLILAISGILVGLLSITLVQTFAGKIQREKTIAFNTGGGQVSISLSAIEEFIKRLSTQLPNIKDLRNNIVATKRGIEVNVRTTLWAEGNIPEITEKVQFVIKNRLQEMLGIEEDILVRVHVSKILSKEEEQPKKKKGKEEPAESPFHGTIEYKK